LDIALGFSPRRSGIWFSYGRLHHARGDYSHAEDAWLRAEQLDPNNVLPLTHLATLYKQQKRLDEYFTYLVRVAHRDDTPVAFLKDLGDLYVLKGDFRQAAAAYSRSLTKGLDSAYVEKVVKAYPQLKGALGW
jgi:tetratricopeptide (TPR) repeat protein